MLHVLSGVAFSRFVACMEDIKGLVRCLHIVKSPSKLLSMLASDSFGCQRLLYLVLAANELDECQAA